VIDRYLKLTYIDYIIISGLVYVYLMHLLFHTLLACWKFLWRYQQQI